MPSRSCRRRTKDSCLRHRDHCTYTTGKNRHCRRRINVTYKNAITKKLLTLYKEHKKTVQRKRPIKYSTPTPSPIRRHRHRHRTPSKEEKLFGFF